LNVGEVRYVSPEAMEPVGSSGGGRNQLFRTGKLVGQEEQ